MRFPIRCDQYELRPEPAAPGRWRGGIGIIRRNRFLVDGVYSCEGDRQTDPPRGIFGGWDGLVASCRKNPDTAREEVLPAKVTGIPFAAGEFIEFREPNAAGYGDPLDRPAEAVREDVLDDFTTIELARDAYGVVFADERTLEIDVAGDRGAAGRRCGRARRALADGALRRPGAAAGERRRRPSRATPSSGWPEEPGASASATSAGGAPGTVKAYEQVAEPLRGGVVSGRARARERGCRPRPMLATEFGVSRADRARGAQAARRPEPDPHREGRHGRQLRDASRAPVTCRRRCARASGCSRTRGTSRSTSCSRRACCSRCRRRGSPPAGAARLRPRAPARGDPGQAARARHAGAVRLQRGLPPGRARGVGQHRCSRSPRSPSSTCSRRRLARSKLGARFHRTINDHHRSIAAAIEAGDEDAAGGEMHDHVEFLRPYYEKAWRDVREARVTVFASASRAAGSSSAELPDRRRCFARSRGAPRSSATTRSGPATTSRSRTRSSTSPWRLPTFAAVTSRITIGAGIVLLPLRPPALVAKEFASLDYVSGGRVVLGVGVGGESAQDFEAVGVPIRERGARADEAMLALRELFAQLAGRASRAGSPASRASRSSRGRRSRAGRRSGSAAARRRRCGARAGSATAGCRSGSRPSGTPPAGARSAGTRRAPAAIPMRSSGCRRPGARGRRRARARELTRAHLGARYGDDFSPQRSSATASPGRRRSARRASARTSTAGVRAHRLQPGGRARSAVGAGRAARRRGPGGGRVTLPLADVRVVAIEQFGAGPWGTLQLADLGAEMIKIEDPSSAGDVGRYVPPFQEGEDSLFFETFNRGKKSVSLDLRHPEARGVFEDLVRVCDAVYSNLRGDQPRKLGLTYEQLKGVNPAIVCCSLSGFGMTGPARLRGRLRLHDAGARGLAEPDGRARAARRRRAGCRSSTSRAATRRRSRCSRASGARGATASAATATSRCSRRRCTS